MSDCVHYWIITEVDDKEVGKCKKCGAEKVFRHIDLPIKKRLAKSFENPNPIRHSSSYLYEPGNSWDNIIATLER